MALTTISPVLQAMIPFLFVFAVVFGLLELTKVFKNRAVEAAIAVALAAFAATQTTFTTMLMSWLPAVVSLFVIIFFIAFILELTGLRKARTQPEKIGVLGIVLLLLFAVGGVALSQLDITLPYIGGPQNILFAIGLIFIVSLFWLAFRIGEGKPEKAEGG